VYGVRQPNLHAGRLPTDLDRAIGSRQHSRPLWYGPLWLRVERDSMFDRTAIALCVVAWGGVSIDRATAAEPFTFHYRSPRANDESVQDLQFVLHLHTSITEGGKVTEETDQTVDTRQRRHVQILEARGRAATKVMVQYEAAQQTFKDTQRSGTAAQPVEGKAYIIERVGEDLSVKDSAGKTPPDEEVAFVARNMDAVGRVNPLAEYLDGKSLGIGESITLPAEVARSLLGLDQQLQDEAVLQITLGRERTLEGSTCAEFETNLRANARSGDGFSLLVTGKMWIEPATCRLVAAELSGPVAIFPDARANPASPKMQTQGQLKIALRSWKEGDARHPRVAAPRTNAAARLR
jgi:hypothetical protein